MKYILQDEDGKSGNDSTPTGIQSEWKEVEGLRDQNVIKIVGTSISSFALTNHGTLLAFGDKEYLGLSLEDQKGCTEAPILHPAFNTTDR